jgi:hypothetical protein
MGLDLSAECDGDMYNDDDDCWSCTKCSKVGIWCDSFTHLVAPRHYSTSIGSAWEVLPTLLYPYIWHGKDFWECGMRLAIDDERALATAPTAPLAICRAALLAVLGDKT